MREWGEYGSVVHHVYIYSCPTTHILIFVVAFWPSYLTRSLIPEGHEDL